MLAPAQHRFSVEEYYRLAETGVLRPDARVELLDGQIIDMSPIGPFHGGVTKDCSARGRQGQSATFPGRHRGRGGIAATLSFLLLFQRAFKMGLTRWCFASQAALPARGVSLCPGIY